MYKKYYSHFLSANYNIQHYASHSHHYWPDVTREAMLEYWDDSARYIDDKWSYFFETKIPKAQKQIAQILNISKPEQISFAANTHEFVYRLISCFDPRKKIKVITSDSEFYSFDRQINRLQQEKLIEVIKVPTSPFDNFQERFKTAIQNNNPDMVFISQVFFNSGMVLNKIEEIVESIKNINTMIVLDGYHGFMAVPTDLSKIQDRIFYLAGSYKYAQGGEGCCFLYSPPKNKFTPNYTGWFAGFGDLANNNSTVTYPIDGMKFAGSTMDFSSLYRLSSVLDLFEKEKINVHKIHQHVQGLQQNFRDHLTKIDHPYLMEKNILSVDYQNHGHFYTFAMPSPEHTKKLHDELRSINIWTDYRGSKLRFGFAIYQNDCIDLTNLIKKS
jgi:selenocysteine lyase/cysteine desulfurase